MRIHQTYVFLVRFSAILLVFLVISLVVKSFVEDDDPLNIAASTFNAISEKKADSLITLLSIDQKLDLIFQYNIPDNDKVSGAIEDTSHNLKMIPDTLESEMDSGNSNGLNFFLNHQRFDLITISCLPNLHAVTDTTFLFNYLIYQSHRFDSTANRIVCLETGSSEIRQLGDSIFATFFIKQFNTFKNHFINNNRLLGISLNQNDLDQISHSDSKNDRQFLALLLSSDVLCIDSVSEPDQFTLPFDGLIALKASKDLINKDDLFIKLLKSPANLVFIDSAQVEPCKMKTKELIGKNVLSINELNQKIRKIIKAKLWMELGNSKTSLAEIKRLPEAYYSNRLAQLSIALLNNPDSMIPVKNISSRNFLIVWIGNHVNKAFLENCNYYVQAKNIQLNPGKKDWKKKLGSAVKNNFCIFVVDTLLTDTAEINQFKAVINSSKPGSLAVINVKNYGNLKFIPGNISIIQVQSNTQADYQFSAQAIFGGISISGQLPYTVSDKYRLGLRKYSPKTRLKYSIPEEAGLDANRLEEIDRIATSSISNGAFPGCQVFVAKNGQVVYNKCFGYHTWSKNEPVKESDVYDLASVTKIAATTIAAMKMISDRKMALTDVLGKFFKDTKIDYTRIKPDTVVNIDTFPKNIQVDWKKFLKDRDTFNLNDSSFVVVDTIIYKLTPRLNIFKVPLIDLLRHQSGIAPALPIWRYMYYKAYYIKQMKERMNALHGKTGPLVDFKSFELPESFPENTTLADSLKKFIKQGFKNQYNEYFSTKFVKDSSDIRIADNLFLRNKYFDTIWRDTKQLPVYGRKVFIYSDINMILLQFAIDSLNRQSIDQYMKKTFYTPLGLRNISYLPLKYFPKTQIIPTEQEIAWRYAYLHGYVHDPSAALLGGMAGNAGLYASAHDLGVLFQMVLNKGTYGGIRYINPKIIEQFTTRIQETQRGLGFDMPNRKAKVGSKAPSATYGHSGYTGTCIWVDPENELVYVFLANRNHPKATNWRINGQFVRERVHNAIYDAVINKAGKEKQKGQLNL